jgi:hypothetical protein
MAHFSQTEQFVKLSTASIRELDEPEMSVSTRATAAIFREE